MAIPDIRNLLDTARRIQEEVARVRETLGGKTVTAETGGGLVRCVANGKGEIVSIAIDPTILSDRGMVEDLTRGAVNLALERARELAQAELGQATNGLPLPPGIFG